MFPGVAGEVQVTKISVSPMERNYKEYKSYQDIWEKKNKAAGRHVDFLSWLLDLLLA